MSTALACWHQRPQVWTERIRFRYWVSLIPNENKIAMGSPLHREDGLYKYPKPNPGVLHIRSWETW